MVKVKNINGSGFYTGAPAGYSSWLAYWEDKAQRKAYRCSAMDCKKWTSDLVGAHVKKVGSYDQKYYIVPLCRGCNNRTDEFYVDAELIPCPSNI